MSTVHQLPFDEFLPSHNAHVSADGRYRSMFHTIERTMWVHVAQVVDSDVPVRVYVYNQDVEPESWPDNVECRVEIGRFPNTDRGWVQANDYALQVIRAFGHHHRGGTTADHLIARARAVLAESRNRLTLTERSAA